MKVRIILLLFFNEWLTFFRITNNGFLFFRFNTERFFNS